jgi:outer membrane protein TolC
VSLAQGGDHRAPADLPRTILTSESESDTVSEVPPKSARPVQPFLAPARAAVRSSSPEDLPAAESNQTEATVKGKESALSIDLPTALRLVNASNPTIALARERVAEAYARLDQAKALWLPTLESVTAYNRHDGRIQNSTGIVFDTSKSNFFEGGGAVMRWQSSDVLFGPLIARRLVQAQEDASRAVTDDVQLDVALTYLDLLRVYGALAINADTLARAEDMAYAARSAIAEGKSKTGADLNRAMTEVHVRREERRDLQGQAAEVSARLAQLLLLEPTVDLHPADPAIVPIVLIPDGEVPLDELVATGLLNRPELAESRALVTAALARWHQAKVSPLLPRIEVSYVAGTFGGGLNGDLSHFGSRGDGLAQAVWELPGLGAGYLAQTRVQRSQYNQANFHVSEVQAQVAAEVTAAAKFALSRRQALDDAQDAVRQASIMWRKLKEASFGLRGREGRFDPLEPLLAEQALAQARAQYLFQVIEYNKAQFRLYRAMGQPPASALPKAAALSVSQPVAPPPPADVRRLPAPRALDRNK